MAAVETTNLDQAGVAQDDVSKMAAFLDTWNPDDPRKPKQIPAEPSSQAQAQPEPAAVESQSQAELTPADLPDEAAPVETQPAVEQEIEIVHNGQTHKIATRAEQIDLMQKGFDYTQKTQTLAEASRAAAERVQRAEALEQV